MSRKFYPAFPKSDDKGFNADYYSVSYTIPVFKTVLVYERECQYCNVEKDFSNKKYAFCPKCGRIYQKWVPPKSEK